MSDVLKNFIDEYEKNHIYGSRYAKAKNLSDLRDILVEAIALYTNTIYLSVPKGRFNRLPQIIKKYLFPNIYKKRLLLLIKLHCICLIIVKSRLDKFLEDLDKDYLDSIYISSGVEIEEFFEENNSFKSIFLKVYSETITRYNFNYHDFGEESQTSTKLFGEIVEITNKLNSKKITSRDMAKTINYATILDPNDYVASGLFVKRYKYLVENKIHKPQPFDPNEFPTLLKYNSQMIENKIQSLMKTQGMTRQQCLVNLEQDLSELER